MQRGILSLLCVFFAPRGKKDTHEIENDWQAKAPGITKELDSAFSIAEAV
jgi:hypothetical protein